MTIADDKAVPGDGPGLSVSGTAILLRGLAKTYAGTGVLHGIDLSIAAGDRVALIGPNGAGKSTLLKCVIGLETASNGHVETLGETLSGRPAAAVTARLRRQIGFVFQNHSLVRRRSALSNVVHGVMGLPGGWRAFSHTTAPGPAREAAMQALDSVGLADRALARVDTLSGGQQQRVAIARALVRQPRLLIADEPAASLDPQAGREVMALFVRLCRAHGITLLYTTHDMDHAVAFADRIVALKAGRLALDTPAGDCTADDLQDFFEARHAA